MFLDHNAGGRVRPEVAAHLNEWLRAPVANPSSLHAAGRRARAAIEQARDAVARLVGADPSEVVFTSGATEANNQAIRGLSGPDRGVVTTSIEHSSVLEAVAAAERNGSVVRQVAPGADGLVAPEAVAEVIRHDTVLVTVGWANGEIGTVQPIAAIADAIRAVRPGVCLHSDAVQAVSSLEIDGKEAGVDLLSLSAHKLGAPAGVGALVIRDGVALAPLLLGGPQERERRAGTENVPGIVAFGVAARMALEERSAYAARARRIREAVWEVLSRVPPVLRFGRADGLAGTLAVAFPDLRGDALAAALDLRGVAVSTGSACAAGAPEPSHVLRAIGVAEEPARGGLRLSFGPELTIEDALRAAGLVVDTVERARARREVRSVSSRDCSGVGASALPGAAARRVERAL